LKNLRLYHKGYKMAKIIKKAESIFSKFERSLEDLADKIL
jgi:hypothetical protein